MFARACAVVLILIFVFLWNPGISGSFGIGKYAGEFLSIGGGARALGMGGAYVAVAAGAETGVWNPAGLSEIQYPQVVGMHSRRFGGIVNYDFAAIALPFHKNEGLALSLTRLAVDDIPETALPRPDLPINATYTDVQGTVLANRPYIERLVNNADYALYLSYSKKKNELIEYGTNIKLIRRGVGDYSAWGLGFDIGIIVRPIGNLQLGANLQDVTSTLIAWNTGRRELVSPTLKTGFAYPLQLNFISSEILFCSDTDVRFEGREFSSQFNLGALSMDFHLGSELLVKRVVALRLGSDIGYLSAGAGIRLPRLAADYAFLSHDELGKTHRVSLRISLEEERFARH